MTDTETLNEARKEFLAKEINTALKYLRVPIIGKTLYTIAKTLKYD